MVTWSSHGGGCCGILHFWDFNEPRVYLDGAGKSSSMPDKGETLEHWLVRFIERALQSSYGDEYNEEDVWNAVVEVVLTTAQINAGWGGILKRIGFKEVTTFHNSNSGNTCHILHLQTEDI